MNSSAPETLNRRHPERRHGDQNRAGFAVIVGLCLAAAFVLLLAVALTSGKLETLLSTEILP